MIKKKWNFVSGVYKIQLEANKNYVLDVAGGSTANERQMSRFYTNNETDAQNGILQRRKMDGIG